MADNAMLAGNAIRPRQLAIAGIALLLLLAALGWRLWNDSERGDPASEGPQSVPGELAPAPTIDQLRLLAEAAPEDAQAWQELGFAYFTAGRFGEAVEAYDRAARNDPESAVLWSSLGEAQVMASTGEPMPPAALESFRKGSALDPADPRARYFLAVEKDLAGDHQGAISGWLALLADTPPGAPWENDLVRTIEQVGTLRGIEVDERILEASATRDILPSATQNGIPGPTQQQLAAAASLSPSQQQDMAEGMVERLAARLESDPANVDGWIMLMRSYITLGREEQAQEAYADALAANPASREILQQAATTLGL